MDFSKIAELAKKYEPDMTRFLRDMIKIPSESCGEKEVVLYSSDLLRAKETAEQIGKSLGLVPKLRFELRERNLGKCCGQSVQWLRDNIEQVEKSIDDRMFSDAESRRDEWNRLKPFLTV